ncbi:MAG: PAS domain-containing protein [Anaerolineales bacterium]|nr:PAS domain-containing protein [Anaerolineales bacterium]
MTDTRSSRNPARKVRAARKSGSVRKTEAAAPPLLAMLKPAPSASALSPQSITLAEIHHELLFALSYPRGIVTDVNPLVLRKLNAERESVIGRALAELLGVPEIMTYLKDLPVGRPVRFSQRLTLGADGEAAVWDIRAARAVAAEGEALLTMRLLEERRPAASAGAPPRFDNLPAAVMEAADLGSAEPLLDWALDAAQASGAGLFYAHRESGEQVRGFERNLPADVPHELPPLPSSDRNAALIWKRDAKIDGEFFPWAAACGWQSAMLFPLPDSPVKGALLLGWKEAESPAWLETALTAFSASHAALLRGWQSRQQVFEMQRKGKRAETAMQVLMEELPQALALVRVADGRVMETSLSCERMLGYSGAALAAMRLEDWLTAPEAVVAVRAACQSGRINESGELTLYRRDGEGFPAVLRAIPLRSGETAEFHEVLVTITDLTSSRDARLEARHLQRQAVLGWMAASFAHEIRNPLNNLSLQLEELRTLYQLPGEASKLVGDSKAECDRLTEISRRMLDFARGQDFRPAPTDIAALVRRVLARMQPVLERAGVKSLFSAPEDLPQAMADPMSIEQVILNLIDNAAKAMPEGGHLGVSLQLSALESGAPAVEVRVADTGQGLPPQVREKLFQPYVTTRSDGHGLGLALSRHILDAHRGALRADTYPGSGTVFRVFLPVASPPTPLPA